MTDRPEDFAARSDQDELRPVTSLFADVVGSTSLGERLSAIEVKALIGECVTRMCEAIEGFGGCVRSYMGDGIAGFFGIDSTREDDTERAARAALEIRRVISIYSVEAHEAWGVEDFNVRIGVNVGRVAVGPVGAGDPQRVALGDSVNVAARLQSAAQPGAIVIGEDVAKVIADRFIVRPIGEVEIRGRKSRVRAYELESAESPGVHHALTRFIGRSDELDRVGRSLAELVEGRGQVLLIGGEGGIGKTRLLDETRRRASSEVVWLDGYCDPMDQRLPYEPFCQALRSWLGLDVRASSIEARVRLSARGRELFGESFEECAPHLARLLGIELGTKLDRSLDGLPSEVLSAGLLSTYTRWLALLAEQSPVVLAIDNFECASQSTIQLTEALLESVGGAPLLLVLAMRSGVDAPSRRLRVRALTDYPLRSVDISLRPLESSQSRELVSELSGPSRLGERLVALIVERAEGNPLYIEELCVAVGESGEGEAESAVPPLLPGALEGLLLSRIDGLPAEARSVLQSAAILGRAFKAEVLAAMAGSQSFDAAIGVLLQADVIRERGRQPRAYVFRHGLVREAALSTLSPLRYKQLNGLAARALKSWPGFELERDAETLAGYYLACDELGEAIECLELLAERLALVCRWGEAADLLRRCLSELTSAGDHERFARLAGREAELLAVEGRFNDAIVWLDEALEKVTDPSVREELQLSKARYLTDAGHPEVAEDLLRHCLDGGANERSRPRFITLRGELALSRGDQATAAECVHQLGDIAALRQELGFGAASLAAGVCAKAGALDDAEFWALRAQAVAEQLGQIGYQLTARRHVAIICMLKGYLDEAHHLMSSVYAQYSRLEFLAGRLSSALNLMHLRSMLGDLRGGASIGYEVLGSEIGEVWTCMISSNLAVIKCEQGEFDDAKQLASVALEASDRLPGWARSSARQVLATIARENGDLVGESTQLTLAYEEAAANGWSRELNIAAAHLAAAAIRADDRRLAARWAAEALRNTERLERSVVAIAERAYAMTLEPENIVEGLSLLQGRLDETVSTGLVLDRARTLMAMGQLDPERAPEYFADSQRLFEECGCRLGLRELDAARERSGQMASAPN